MENRPAYLLHVSSVGLLICHTKRLIRGRSSVSPDEQFVVVSNLFDGFDWYLLSDRTIRHTIPIRINPQKNLPVPVIFTADGNGVVTGSTGGSARVLDSRTSETTQLLPHDGALRSIPSQFDGTQAYV